MADIKKIIKDLQGNFGGSNEDQLKSNQLIKGLATSDDPLANKFMKKLDTATTKISKEVLGGDKKEESTITLSKPTLIEGEIVKAGMKIQVVTEKPTVIKESVSQSYYDFLAGISEFSDGEIIMALKALEDSGLYSGSNAVDHLVNLAYDKVGYFNINKTVYEEIANEVESELESKLDLDDVNIMTFEKGDEAVFEIDQRTIEDIEQAIEEKQLKSSDFSDATRFVFDSLGIDY